MARQPLDPEYRQYIENIINQTKYASTRGERREEVVYSLADLFSRWLFEELVKELSPADRAEVDRLKQAHGGTIDLQSAFFQARLPNYNQVMEDLYFRRFPQLVISKNPK